MNNPTQWQADLQSQDVDRRIAAAEGLASAGEEAAVAAVELVRGCGDVVSVQQWAVAALESMGPPKDQSRSQLDELTTSSEALVAYWAITLLGRLGPAAAESQDALAKVLSTGANLANRERAAWALGKIGASSALALSALTGASQAAEPRLSQLAQKALLQAQT